MARVYGEGMNAAEITEGTRVRVSRPKFRATLDRAPFEGTVYRYPETDMLAVDDNDGLPVILIRSNGEQTGFPVEVLA